MQHWRDAGATQTYRTSWHGPLLRLPPTSTAGLQGDRGLVEIAARTPTGGVGHQHEPAGRDRVDPAAGADAAVVLRLPGSLQVKIAQRGRTEDQQSRGAGQDAAAVRSRELEGEALAREQVPLARLGVDRAVVQDGPR